MKFYSTNKKVDPLSFKEAVIHSLPSDRGLYFPEKIPTLDSDFFKELNSYTLSEIGSKILAPFTHEDIPKAKLKNITEEAFNFDVPLKKVENGIYSLELFHGPTYAFKDIGARFLARCLAYFNESHNQEVTILVATSGDTGGAVASGFYDVDGVNVVILYPSGKVSELQEKQLTTLGKNITAVEIDGTFDDCQNMVKQAFLDKELNETLNLSSANSINIARWLPQSIYYFEAFKQLQNRDNLVFSVPSGNYGNLSAGLLAQRMGLSVKHFIAASNQNDVIPRFLTTEQYEPLKTIPTLSNAMDVSDPSNYPRLMELVNGKHAELRSLVKGFSMDDAHTLETIKSCFEQNSYITDPHGAIGYQALKDTMTADENGIFLETAHYCKFVSTVEKALEKPLSQPGFVSELMSKPKKSITMSNSFKEFKSFLFG
ncbi:threonine synthase [Balneola sp. EhC07]|uniref:threonine synthase n=1 Tax=Balneola sp. EhC07 TaxID=1849360 RepID=UPI0007F42AE6|nr:threonine synthase [Balneola sp. EhC07]OAN64725.1 threonine synthase [Balneola sp. EhC07]